MSASRSRTIGAWLVALVLVGSALAVGAVEPVVLGLVMAVSCVAVWVLHWNRDGFVSRRGSGAVVVLGLALIAYTALQALPLPRGLVATLSPHAADVWARSLHPFGEEGPSWVSFSLDRPATLTEVAKGVTYLLVFVAVLRICRRGDAVRWFERALIASSVIVALVTAVHLGLGLDRVYGFYRPHTDVTAIAPLLNTNHLAAYVNVGLLIALASAISEKPVAPRPLLVAPLLLLLGAEVWFASRGAIASMMLGASVIVSLAIIRRPAARRTIVAPVVLAMVVVLGVAFTLMPTTGRLAEEHDVSKLGIPAQVFSRMVPHYPLFGCGRGAFESTFPEFREGHGFLVWSHPENLVAQWISEWGVPVGVAAIAVVLWSFRPRNLSFERGTLGPWCVLLALGIHNMVDFNLEIPAVGIAASVCAAMVLAGTSPQARSRLDRWSERPQRIASIGLALAAAAGLGLVFCGRDLLVDREALYRASQPGAATAADFHANLRRAMTTHPAEPYFPYVAAVRALRTPDESVVPWIGHTLERAPLYPMAHLVLARALRRTSPAQARLEYRLYAEQSGGAVLDVREISPLVDSLEDALEVAPDTKFGLEFLDQLSESYVDRLPATSARIDANILARGATGGPTRREARRALMDAQGAPWCEESPGACRQAALEWAIRTEKELPDRCEGYELHARSIALGGNGDEAMKVLRDAQGVVRDRSECQTSLIRLALDLGRTSDVSSEIEVLSRLPCDSSSPCVANILAAGELEASIGNGSRAYAFARRAHELDPDDETTARIAAGRASAIGLHGEAASTYDDLARRHSDKPQYKSLAAAERSLMARPGDELPR